MLQSGGEFKYQCANSAQLGLYKQLIEFGEGSSPRGLGTKELLSVGFEIANPRMRLTTLTNRRFSSKLAVGELCWHLRGSTSANELAYYAPRWMEFADADGIIRGSCYGHKIFDRLSGGQSQWELVSDLLKRDANSRRAVLSFHSPDFLQRAGHAGDVACISSLQFFLRNDRLNATTVMRSNDVFWGLPYDIFIMSSLQEMMAANLGLKLGSYHHYCGSLHVYDDKVPRILEVLDSHSEYSPEMAPIFNLRERHSLLAFEKTLRVDGQPTEVSGSKGFWDECKTLLLKK